MRSSLRYVHKHVTRKRVFWNFFFVIEFNAHISRTNSSFEKTVTSILNEDIFIFSYRVFQPMKPITFLEITCCCWKPLTNVIRYCYYYYCDNDYVNFYIFELLITVTNTYDNSEEYCDSLCI
jgi:hypothetical protein